MARTDCGSPEAGNNTRIHGFLGEGGRVLGWHGAGPIELLSAYFRARRGRPLELCADSDFRAVRRTHDLGRVSRILVVSAESPLAAPSTAPLRWKGCRGGRADDAGADRHPSAVERAVDRFRGANFGAAAEAAAVRGRA